MKPLLVTTILISLLSFKQDNGERAKNFPKATDVVTQMPEKEKVWVFILAGQSNMAGRGFVEPQDMVPDKRVLTINAKGQLIYAKEPLHFYEPAMTGLDCGLSFGKTLLPHVPADVSVLLIPTAVGGSSISQWLEDSVHRSVKLLTNFHEKMDIGRRYGQLKGILWHQGENDANEKDIPLYPERLSRLCKEFRSVAGNPALPVLFGELGSYSKDDTYWKMLNHELHNYSLKDKKTAVIATGDFKDKGDKIHFNSEGQRLLGKRFAEAYIKLFL